MQWHAKKAAAAKEAEEEALRERRRKGLLTGREIFQQACLHTPVAVTDPLVRLGSTDHACYSQQSGAFYKAGGR